MNTLSWTHSFLFITSIINFLRHFKVRQRIRSSVSGVWGIIPVLEDQIRIQRACLTALFLSSNISSNHRTWVNGLQHKDLENQITLLLLAIAVLMKRISHVCPGRCPVLSPLSTSQSPLLYTRTHTPPKFLKVVEV